LDLFESNLDLTNPLIDCDYDYIWNLR